LGCEKILNPYQKIFQIFALGSDTFSID